MIATTVAGGVAEAGADRTSSIDADAGNTVDAVADRASSGGSDGNFEAALPLDAGDGGSADACHQATSSCRSDCECPSFEPFCLAPEDPGCGAPPPLPCTTSSECPDAAVGLICAPFACGGSVCTPPCKSDQQCAAIRGEVCNIATGICGPRPCSLAADCPTNYTCSLASGAGACVRKPCTVDTDCVGTCINGKCSSSTTGGFCACQC
jgi:hypothetical protein